MFFSNGKLESVGLKWRTSSLEMSMIFVSLVSNFLLVCTRILSFVVVNVFGAAIQVGLLAGQG